MSVCSSRLTRTSAHADRWEKRDERAVGYRPARAVKDDRFAVLLGGCCMYRKGR